MKAKRISKGTFVPLEDKREKIVVKRERTFAITPRTVYDIESSHSNTGPTMSSFGFGRTHATCNTLEDAREVMRILAKDAS